MYLLIHDIAPPGCLHAFHAGRSVYWDSRGIDVVIDVPRDKKVVFNCREYRLPCGRFYIQVKNAESSSPKQNEKYRRGHILVFDQMRLKSLENVVEEFLERVEHGSMEERHLFDSDPLENVVEKFQEKGEQSSMGEPHLFDFGPLEIDPYYYPDPYHPVWPSV